MGNISMSYYGRLKHIAMFSEAFKCTHKGTLQSLQFKLCWV